MQKGGRAKGVRARARKRSEWFEVHWEPGRQPRGLDARGKVGYGYALLFRAAFVLGCMYGRQ